MEAADASLHAGVPNATSVGNGSITDRTNNAVNRAQTEKQPRKAVLGPLIHRDDDHVWRKVCQMDLATISIHKFTARLLRQIHHAD